MNEQFRLLAPWLRQLTASLSPTELAVIIEALVQRCRKLENEIEQEKAKRRRKKKFNPQGGTAPWAKQPRA